MNRTGIIKSIIFAAVALAAGIFPERSEHCEAMSLEGCAWAKTETIGGYSWAYRINGETAEIRRGRARAPCLREHLI